MPSNVTHYNEIQEAIDAGVSNMTVLRNNSKNDDSTTTYNIEGSWVNFKFNGVDVNTIYSSGNSWLGFGAPNTNLMVNQRDTAVWYEYIEYGTIGELNFIKFRWRGYSVYSSTASNTLLVWEIFIFDNHQILFNYVTVPTSSFTNNNAIDGVYFQTQSGTPCEYTFTPDTEEGNVWTVGTERPNVHPVPPTPPTPSDTANYRGPYISGVTYYMDDIVEYQKDYYRALNNVPVRTPPTNTTYWRKLSKEVFQELYSNEESSTYGRIEGTGGDSKGIDNIEIDDNNHLVIHYTDGTSDDAGLMPGTTVVPNAPGTAVGNLSSLLVGEDLYNVAQIPVVQRVVLRANGWSANKQSVVIDVPILANSTRQLFIPCPYVTVRDTYYDCQVRMILAASSTNSVTFQCDTVPNIDLTVDITIMNTYSTVA